MLCVAGLERAGGQDEADVVIFNTCSIRDTAARKVLTHISQACERRRKERTGQVVCVVGCIGGGENKGDGTTRSGDYTRKILGRADIVLGTNQAEELVERITGARPDTRFGVENSVIITHGCNNFCAYCIVPYARGREWSRDIDDIVAEFTDCAKRGEGARVIYLLGQNVNSYKCPRTGAGFVGLLDRLCEVARGFEGVGVNFLSSHPKDFGRELVDCIARNEVIERNIHLPLQSGCDKILHAMNRGYSVAQFLEKIEMLRDAVPGVHITTDVICGFPGESEADYNETVEVMRRVRFNAAFIFAYSPREGTKAATMGGQVPEAERKRRATELIKIQQGICK